MRTPYWLGDSYAWQGLVRDGSWEYILDEEDRQHKQTHNKKPKPLVILFLHISNPKRHQSGSPGTSRIPNQSPRPLAK